MQKKYVSALQHFEAEYVKPKQGRTLIVGSQIYGDKPDRRKLYPNVIGIDMLEGPGVDMVADLETDQANWLAPFDHIECMSVLEHSRRPWLLAENLVRLLAPGGTIFVAVPFMWRVHNYPSDFWRFTPEGIKALFTGIEWESVALAHAELTFGTKLPSEKRGVPWFPRTETVAFGRKPEALLDATDLNDPERSAIPYSDMR